jgi:hypothetical protein
MLQRHSITVSYNLLIQFRGKLTGRLFYPRWAQQGRNFHRAEAYANAKLPFVSGWKAAYLAAKHR